MIKALKQSGDTLVEVLIAIAVLSAVLGGAYAASNRSLRVVRQTQERGEALKIAETQLEKLKALPTNPTGDVCFALNTIAASAGSCDIVQGGATYTATIHFDAPSNSYQILVDWDNVRGGNDKLEMWYRK